jgi:hypothetical protein
MFDAGREEFTIKDMIARAVYVLISKFYEASDALARRSVRVSTERQLRRLPDALLHDIGLERADIPKVVSHLQTPGR